MAAARMTELKKMNVSFGISRFMLLLSNGAKAIKDYNRLEFVYLN